MMRKLLKKQGFAPDVLVTDKLRSYGAAKSEIGLSAPPRDSARDHLAQRIRDRDERARAPSRRRRRRRRGRMRWLRRPSAMAPQARPRSPRCGMGMRSAFARLPRAARWRRRSSPRKTSASPWTTLPTSWRRREGAPRPHGRSRQDALQSAKQRVEAAVGPVLAGAVGRLVEESSKMREQLDSRYADAVARAFAFPGRCGARANRLCLARAAATRRTCRQLPPASRAARVAQGRRRAHGERRRSVAADVSAARLPARQRRLCGRSNNEEVGH
jgi:hypothetical protein